MMVIYKHICNLMYGGSTGSYYSKGRKTVSETASRSSSIVLSVHMTTKMLVMPEACYQLLQPINAIIIHCVVPLAINLLDSKI